MKQKPFTPFIVEPDPDGGIRVRIGDAHTGVLTMGETIEQVLALMRPPLRDPYPMRTDEEWAARFPHRRAPETGE